MYVFIVYYFIIFHVLHVFKLESFHFKKLEQKDIYQTRPSESYG